MRVYEFCMYVHANTVLLHVRAGQLLPAQGFKQRTVENSLDVSEKVYIHVQLENMILHGVEIVLEASKEVYVCITQYNTILRK